MSLVFVVCFAALYYLLMPVSVHRFDLRILNAIYNIGSLLVNNTFIKSPTSNEELH